MIKKIVPTIMTSEGFLESAIYNLSKDKMAHGGFELHKDVKGIKGLAEGVGREKVTGVLPLYLFKEHWEIAKRKSPPIYGFMCTLDVMGY